jgi:preprotein translocase subunit YajC
MFITPAFAQAAGQATGGGMLNLIVPMVGVFAIMYFLMIRPQQQKMKAHGEMIASLKRNDVVVTSGGIIGKVIRVLSDAEILVEIADGVRVRVVRATVTEVRTRGDVREVEARKAVSRKDKDDADDDSDAEAPLVAANDTNAPKKD